ncbi:universal stress protein [Legionella fallonii]|uniref:universal stress protein n=1 Tax=Legionella fallonii TaxID=96230 RepID=UPI0005D344F0|nr:universal stress protein [Legionella fallonii]
MYKNILLAVDGSNASNSAVEEVIKLIKDQNTHLRVIHVVDENMAYHGGPGFDAALIINALKEEGKEILDNAAKTIESQSSIKVEKLLLELRQSQGRIAEMIVDESKKWPTDLLVLGTHGRRGFNRFILGSVAENVIRIATTPVLLVRSSNM